MFASKFALPAAWLLLLGTAVAAPAPDTDTATTQQVANPADPFVTVDEAGIRRTVTPIMTTINGVPTLLTPTPSPDMTGSVLATGTGAAAQPAATDDKGAAAGAACSNTAGAFKPFCQPKHNDVYYPDSTHYITWDSSFFSGANATTLKVLGFYTTNETIPTSGGPPLDEEAFSSDSISAGWGFYQWRLPRTLLTNPSLSSANITLYIVALPKGSQAAQWLSGPTITVQWKPKKEPEPKHHSPHGNDEHALYVALPTVFGVATLLVVGIFFWNRQARRVDLATLLSQNGRGSGRRRGAAGAGASKKDRARNKEQSIRLMERDASIDAEEAGWEEGWTAEVPGRVNRKQM